MLQGKAATDSEGEVFFADHIAITHVLDGPVDAIDRQHARLQVLGLTVYIEPNTVFNLTGRDVSVDRTDSNIDLTTPHVGDRITVSGYTTGDGDVAASRIARSASSGESELTGFVAADDPEQRRVRVGAVIIDYSSAVIQPPDGPGGFSGHRVRASVSRTSDGALRASSLVALPDRVPATTSEAVFVEGLFTAADAVGGARVDGYPISPGAQVNCDPPGNNTHAVVTGVARADGSIATDVLCVQVYPQLFAVHGPLEATNAAFGALSILGFAVQPSVSTFIAEADGAGLLPSDLQIGDALTAFGSRAPLDAVASAAEVDRTNAGEASVIGDRQYLSFRDPYVYVPGRPIEIAADASFDGFAAPMTRSVFFAHPDFTDPDCGSAYTLTFRVYQDATGALTANNVKYRLRRC